MLDDENDKRIKEAADHYHPEYDDTAWQKMEQLLDEHLPVKKERRPILFLIPLTLFIGFFLFLFLYNSKNNKTEAPEILTSKNKTEKVVEPNSADVSKNNTAQPSLVTTNASGTISNPKNNFEKNNTNSIVEKSQKTTSIKSSGVQEEQNTIPVFENERPSKNNTNNPQEITSEEPSNSIKTIEASKNNSPSLSKQNEVEQDKSLPQQETIAKNNIAKTEPHAGMNNGKKARNSNGGFANNFGVNVSAGPDISDVYHNSIGKVTLAYGAGLSYDISKKLNIRTGFYLSKKIYSVSGDDYKIPPGSIGNYQYLESVEANCKVYEIPVKLAYSFGKIKNHSWFVSTGLSSYLMKKESYDYYYKTPSGQVYNKDWSISNKNKHFFSVLDISGGYQYSFNSQFSLIAEPYVNLPLTGIGAGKVKLNSGGILFTMQVKPFSKKK
jgi:hypothetical protein